MRELGAQSQAAFQQEADRKTQEALVDYVEKAVPWACEGVAREVLEARAAKALDAGRALGLSTAREHGFFFAALHRLSPRLVKDEVFRSALQAAAGEREDWLASLFEEGRLEWFGPLEPPPARDDDWSTIL